MLKTPVSVAIINWNGKQWQCEQAIGSALGQTYPHKEIIFVDNGSETNIVPFLRKKFPNVDYYHTESNMGCPGGRNWAADKATGSIIFFMDNDGYWERKDTIGQAVKVFEQNAHIGALYTAVRAPRNGTLDDPVDGLKKFGHQRRCKSSSFRGGASAIRMELFKAIGGFPAHYFRQGEEEYLSLLIYDKGYSIVYAPDLVLVHHGSDYRGKMEIVELNTIRNMIETKVKLYPAQQVFTKVLPRLAYRTIWYYSRGKYREGNKLITTIIGELKNRKGTSAISAKTYQRYQRVKSSTDDWLYDISSI